MSEKEIRLSAARLTRSDSPQEEPMTKVSYLPSSPILATREANFSLDIFSPSTARATM